MVGICRPWQRLFFEESLTALLRTSLYPPVLRVFADLRFFPAILSVQYAGGVLKNIVHVNPL